MSVSREVDALHEELTLICHGVRASYKLLEVLRLPEAPVNRHLTENPFKGKTVLHWVCEREDPQMLRGVIEARPDLDLNVLAVSLPLAPLDTAVKTGSLECLRILVEAGADVNHSEWTIKLAGYFGHVHILHYFANELGIAEAAEVLEGGETAMHMVVVPGFSENLIDYFVNRGVGEGIPVDGPYPRTPLHKASQMNMEAAVKALLSHGADPTRRDENGKLPIELTTSEECKRRLNQGAAAAQGN